MNPEYVSSIVTFVVGLIAFVVYELQKRSEKSNAATIIMMDVRHAEQVAQAILEKGAVDTQVKNILIENNWEKYKHLFASKFSQDDFAAFNRFFSACMEISEARARMLEVFYSGLCAKAEITQKMILEIDPSVPNSGVLREQLIKRVNTEMWNFDPDDPKARITRGLQMMGRLSNTVAFEKLRRYSGMK